MQRQYVNVTDWDNHPGYEELVVLVLSRLTPVCVILQVAIPPVGPEAEVGPAQLYV